MTAWADNSPNGADRGLRVVLVSTVTMNPYVELLRRALDDIPGVRAESARNLTPAWAWRHRRHVDVIHLHWVELQIASPSRGRALKKFVRLVAAVALARLEGITFVYTVHNLAHHEGRHARLNRWANRCVFALADAVHVHDEGVAMQLATLYGRRRGVYVVPHGNYIGAYPVSGTREEARQRLGLLPHHKVFLFLGQIRPYKGVEQLIAAFRRLEGEDYILLIAGNPQDADYAARVAAAAQGDSRIHLRLGYVPDEELHRYLLAADVDVLPYREVTTSGAALLAFSFGLPIVAPRIGCFPALVEGNRGVLYEADDPRGLAEALSRAATLDRDAARRETLAYAESLGWDRLACQHLDAYRKAWRSRR
ncbi:MAG: glycosyltransferase [Anaerolineae bacterium]|nr:glycosyltransferase [Anaerolineae bacterium]